MLTMADNNRNVEQFRSIFEKYLCRIMPTKGYTFDVYNFLIKIHVLPTENTKYNDEQYLTTKKGVLRLDSGNLERLNHAIEKFKVCMNKYPLRIQILIRVTICT